VSDAKIRSKRRESCDLQVGRHFWPRTSLRTLRARPAIAGAIVEALGDRWRAELDPVLAAGLRRRRPWLRILLAPLAVRRRDVERIRDLPYGDAGRENLLDLYRPRSRGTNGSWLVFFPGGGYRSGRKNREARVLLYRLASQGWTCVSANYRRGAATPFPAQLVDAKRVIAWVRQHGAE
jgi:acetyl esterase/lipase